MNPQRLRLVIVLGILTSLFGCSSPTSPPAAPGAPKVKTGTILFNNANAGSYTYSVYDAGNPSASLVSSSALGPFQNGEYSVPTERNLVIRAKDGSKEYHLVQGSSDAVFYVSSRRAYQLDVTYDFTGNKNNLVWTWNVRSDAAFLINTIKVEPGPGSLKVTWKDPDMPDVRGVSVWASENGNTVTVGPGVGAATLTNLTPGKTYAINVKVSYPEANVYKDDMASGVPDPVPQITFDANGGVGYMTPQLGVPGGTTKLVASAFSRPGFVFVGWATTPTGSAVYADGASYTMGSTNVVLYAIWAANQTITFNANGGDGFMNPQVLANGASASLRSNDFRRAGYTFAGWATTMTGAAAYADGAQYTMGAGGVVLYAVWTANQNTITFDANGGTGTMNPQTLATGETANLKANTFTRAGYSFSGWTAGALTFSDGASFTMGTSSITLYAQWKALPWTNSTTANGLIGNLLHTVTVSGSNIYVASSSGLSVSTNGGTTWTNSTTANGLGSKWVYGVVESGATLYAATLGGVSVSINGGTSWTNYTTANGLGLDTIYGVAVSGSNVYAATHGGGLSVSTNGGTSWTSFTSVQGLGNNNVVAVAASGSNLYAATYGAGLSVSTNGGNSWVVYTTAQGLADNGVHGVAVSGGTIYAATDAGLSVSASGGTSWKTYTTLDGLASNSVSGVAVSGSTICAATTGGLSVSTNGGSTWTNYKTTNGLGSNSVNGVAISGTKIYAATSAGLSVSP